MGVKVPYFYKGVIMTQKQMVICRGCCGSKTVDDIDVDGNVIGTRNCNACDGTGAMSLGWIEDSIGFDSIIAEQALQREDLTTALSAIIDEQNALRVDLTAILTNIWNKVNI